MTTKKILVYTVSDFSAYAETCVNMLFDNIQKEAGIDFCVIATRPPSPSFKYKTIPVKSYTNYIGHLKFYPKLPEADYYVYLDSDILFFGSIFNLIPETSDFSIVREPEGLLTDEWHSRHIVDKSTIKTDICGLNAGTFVFKNREFLEEMVTKITAHYNPNYHSQLNAMIEQSVFNHLIGEKCNYDWSVFKDLTDITKIHVPDDFIYDPRIQVYHFCGWTGSMVHKFYRMGNFLNNNKHALVNFKH
jgi:lipopolysaccharide biosynthesis glycosyltransferase